MSWVEVADGPFWIYELPEEDEDYVIGIDAAEGRIRERSAGPVEISDRDPDFNAMSVCRVSDGVEVATYKSNFAVGLFSDDAIALGQFYGKKSDCEQDAFLVPEINGVGYALVESLREKGYPRLYITRTWNHLEQTWLKTVGWRTSTQNRPIMVRDLQDEVRDGTTGVRCIRTATHMAAMAKNRQGKDEAPPGAHDDLAFARMLALQGRKSLLPGARPKDEDAPPKRSRIDHEREWLEEHLETLDDPVEDSVDEDLTW
jgi:hypothetical protein